MVENQQNQQLKVLQSDHGGEYVSTKIRPFVRSRGIVQGLATPGNPHQNGVAERLNRNLMEFVRAELHQKDREKRF